jgi:hypothetical protein
VSARAAARVTSVHTSHVADCTLTLWEATKSKICTTANGFAGKTCPILSVSSGFCGGSGGGAPVCLQAAWPKHARFLTCMYKLWIQANAYACANTGATNGIDVWHKTSSLDPVVWIAVFKLDGSSKNVDAIQVW